MTNYHIVGEHTANNNTSWTEGNTEGFSADQLRVMNEAQAHLEAAYPSVDEANICDMLNNAFHDGILLVDLIARVEARL